jgi:integrase
MSDNIIQFPPKGNEDVKSKQDINSDKEIYSQVEVKKRRDDKFPMVLHKNTGRLHGHANQFLLMRYYHCSFVDEESEQVTMDTMNNYADHIRYFLNICALIEKSYLQIDIIVFESILTMMRKENTDESSISNYVSTWRQFYKYLDKVDVYHQLILPAKHSSNREQSEAESRGDTLNYTRKSKKIKLKKEPLINSKRVKNKSSYISQVLTLDEMKSLIKELRRNDVVYGVMAKVQFDTLLRISEIIDYFPYESNELNPDFLSWGEMHINNMALQEFNFIGKGNKERDIKIDIETMKLIEDKYLSQKMPDSDITIYSQRKLKFQTDYLSTKLGQESKYSIDSDVLWLKEDGHPVTNYMYQEAFRKARNSLQSKGLMRLYINVRSHAMRHSGATHRLVKYRDETGVDIHVDNAGDIHAFLKDLLGHENMDTTYRYIRTVRDKTFSNLAQRTIIRNEELWVDEIKKNPALKKGVEAIKGKH